VKILKLKQMIQSVSRICTACMGSGIVEGVQRVVRNPNNQLDVQETELVERDSQDCYICKGEGVVPSGHFIYIPEEGHHFSEELMDLPNDVRSMIIKTLK